VVQREQAENLEGLVQLVYKYIIK
jgi:hypothetical protein